MSALVVQLRPLAGRWLRTQLARLGPFAWHLAGRRSARAIVGVPLVMLALAGLGMPWWAIGLMTVEGLVVLGFWCGAIWWLRHLNGTPLPGSQGPVAPRRSAARKPRKRS